MTLRVFDDAAAFLDVAGPHLLAHEAENGLPLGVATALRDGRRYGDEPPFLACVTDGEPVTAVAVRTPPYNLLLAWTDRPDWEPIARHLLATGTVLPGVTAEEGVALGFAAWWSKARGVSHEAAMHQRLYRLVAVARPRGVPGHARWAEAEDADRLARWVEAFGAEAIPDSPASNTPALVARHLAARTLRVWDDGGLVSMAAVTRGTPRGASISLVYTPPDRRGRGYASACVANLSQCVLDSGKSFCTLYADLANATSNGVYRRIGYEPLALEIRFRGRGDLPSGPR
ncbi:MAG: GNAT family N-acetyltransferase [Candidatus Bipolaricaulis sp.]|nr:GNAT family N-acetyltransferase [Candidatus Bipolaricaulis sp.]